MSVYQRYFRFTDGPIVAEIARLQGLRDRAAELYVDLGRKYQASGVKNYDRTGHFAGFTFTTPPDTSVFRRDPKSRLWVPRKNVPAGKEIWAEINSLPAPEPIENALRLASLEPGLPMLMGGGRWYAPGLWGYHAPRNIWFVSVPWKDVDPEKLSAYKADNAAARSFDRDLDTLSWEPPADWVEVKRWQIEKEAEEIDAHIKQSKEE